MAHPAMFSIIDTIPGKAKPFIKGKDPQDSVVVSPEVQKQIDDLWDAINV